MRLVVFIEYRNRILAEFWGNHKSSSTSINPITITFLLNLFDKNFYLAICRYFSKRLLSKSSWTHYVFTLYAWVSALVYSNLGNLGQPGGIRHSWFQVFGECQYERVAEHRSTAKKLLSSYFKQTCCSDGSQSSHKAVTNLGWSLGG